MFKVCGHEVAIKLAAAVFITKSNDIYMAMSFVTKLNFGEGGVGVGIGVHIFLKLRASLCKILISSFAHKMDFAHNFSVDFF